MTDPTHRFSVSRTFSDATAILGARWKAMFGTTVLMVIAMLAVYALFAWPLIEAAMSNPLGYSQTVDPSVIGLTMLGGIVAMILAVWLLVALLKLAIEKDAPRGIIPSLAGALPRVPSAIGIAFCVAVVMIALYIASAIAAGVLTFIGAMIGEGAGIATMIVSVLGIFFVIIYVMLGWVVSVPATVAEKTGPIASMARSWRLVKGHRLRLVALWVLTYIAVMIVGIVVMMVTLPGFWAAMNGDPTAMAVDPPGTAALIAFFVINGIINVGVQLFFASLFAATYRNLVTAAGGDPREMAAVFDD